jgi:hypothetical protein
VYDNEVQNEKEQEQQQQVQETKPVVVSVYRGGPRLEESFNAELLTMYSNAAAMNTLALDHAAAAAATDGDGVEEQTETELLLPWYPLSEFAMEDLPCALPCSDANGAMPRERRLSLRLSANHTPRTQPKGIPRRLRNVVALLHCLPPAVDDDRAAGWLMAVTLAEAQSLLLLLRRPSVLTSAALAPGSQDAGDGDVRLAIFLASDGAVLASTAAYDRSCSHGAFGDGGASPGR